MVDLVGHLDPEGRSGRPVQPLHVPGRVADGRELQDDVAGGGSGGGGGRGWRRRAWMAGAPAMALGMGGAGVDGGGGVAIGDGGMVAGGADAGATALDWAGAG